MVPAVALAVQAVVEREGRGAVQKQDRSDRGEHIFHVAAARPWHVSLQLHVDNGHESALVLAAICSNWSFAASRAAATRTRVHECSQTKGCSRKMLKTNEAAMAVLARMPATKATRCTAFALLELVLCFFGLLLVCKRTLAPTSCLKCVGGHRRLHGL